MRKRLFPALLLGLVLLCVLVVSAPARLLPLFVSGGQVALQGLGGTLWNGNASRAMLATDAGYLHLGRVEWRLKPLSLLWLSPTLAIDATWGGQHLRGELRRSPAGNLRLRDAEGNIGAVLLSEFLPVRLDGELSVQLQELLLREGLPQRLTGRLVWQGAGWQSPRGMRPLGSYAVDIETLEDDRIVGQVVTLSGEVNAEGELRWREGEYAVDVLLRGTGLQDPQLRQALQLMASPEGEGFRVRLDGSLPAGA